jgi:hypothetical protein
MNKPSPRSHLYRLAVVLVTGFIGFLVIKALATPQSWNYVVWYRGANSEEMEKLPLIHGGNDSCQSCHEEEHENLTSFGHKTLNCESCHGPLVDHVQGDKKTADAIVMDESNGQCLNCHSELISRPKDFPQFTSEVRRHEAKREDTSCLKCHDAHDPEV